MELSNIFLKNSNLENLCKKILYDKILLEDFLQMISDNPDLLEENFNGKVSVDILVELINSSYYDNRYCLFLESIVDFINGSEINDLIFKKMMEYPEKSVRERFQISLSHKKLNEEQLIFLCNEGIAFECYFELAIIYYTKKKHGINKIKNFIEDFRKCKYSYMLDELKAELIECHRASSMEKLIYISAL